MGFTPRSVILGGIFDYIGLVYHGGDGEPMCIIMDLIVIYNDKVKA